MRNEDLTAELKNISKVYISENPETGEVYRNTALENVDIEFRTSEVHALLGDNGAGKSSLVHIFSGLHFPTNGVIKINNKEVFFSSPAEALKCGIVIVHQAPNLVYEASVFENIILGSNHKYLFPIIRRKKIKGKIYDILREWSIDLDLDAKVKDLSVQDKFFTALVFAILENPKFLILDEPAAVITTGNTISFFKHLHKYSKERKIGIVLITHKLEEALSASDRISILNKGKIETSFFTEELNNENKSLKNVFSNINKPAALSKENQAEIKSGNGKNIGLEIKIFRNRDFESAFFCAEKNSITGIVGNWNSKIENLENILSGMVCKDFNKFYCGELAFCDGGMCIKKINIEKISPAFLLRNKIGFIPSDRHYRASNPNLSIVEILNCYRLKKEIINKKKMRSFAASILLKENIKTEISASCASLSGGQLQRILLARCIEEDPNIIILSEPLRGLDLTSAAQFKTRLEELSKMGKTILILTKESDTDIYKNFFDKIYYLNKNIFGGIN